MEVENNGKLNNREKEWGREWTRDKYKVMER
jgi:hypothetical protein